MKKTRLFGATSAVAGIALAACALGQPAMATNTTPVAQDYIRKVNISGHPTTMNVLANDTYPAGDHIVLTGQDPTQGSWTVDSNNNVVFTSAHGFSGVATSDYFITDGAGHISNTATISVTVVYPASPTTVADTASTTSDAQVTIPVLANDTWDSYETTSPTVSITGQDNNDAGTFVADAFGKVVFTPDGDFSGKVSATYVDTDEYGHDSLPATITVTVKAAPVAPVGPVVTTNSSSVRINANKFDKSGSGVVGDVPTSTVSIKGLSKTDDNLSGKTTFVDTAGKKGPTLDFTAKYVDGKTVVTSAKLTVLPGQALGVLTAKMTEYSYGSSKALHFATPKATLLAKEDSHFGGSFKAAEKSGVLTAVSSIRIFDIGSAQWWTRSGMKVQLQEKVGAGSWKTIGTAYGTANANADVTVKGYGWSGGAVRLFYAGNSTVWNSNTDTIKPTVK